MQQAEGPGPTAAAGCLRGGDAAMPRRGAEPRPQQGNCDKLGEAQKQRAIGGATASQGSAR